MPADERARRSAAGRRPGNPETRAALIAAAREHFVRDGYDGVTVRAIAADAGVDPALINYFFGGKRGLFAEAMALTVSPADVAASVLPGPLEDLAQRLLRGVLETWDDPRSGPPLVALVRAAAGDEQIAGMLRGFAESEIVEPIRKRLEDATADRAAAIGTQILGLIYARYVLALHPVASADPEDVVRRHAPAIQAVIDGPGS